MRELSEYEVDISFYLDAADTTDAQERAREIQALVYKHFNADSVVTGIGEG